MYYTLRLPTPPMETPYPPNVTPRKGPPNRWQLDTLANIPRSLRVYCSVICLYIYIPRASFGQEFLSF